MKYLLAIFSLVLLNGCNSSSVEVNADSSPAEHCKCILLEKYDLLMDFTLLNKSGYYLVGSSLASDNTYIQGHSCEGGAHETSKEFYCIGDCDSGNLSVKMDEKGYQIKFDRNLWLEGGYDIDRGEPIGKKIIIEDRDYIRGRCVPCPK